MQNKENLSDKLWRGNDHWCQKINTWKHAKTLTKVHVTVLVKLLNKWLWNLSLKCHNVRYVSHLRIKCVVPKKDRGNWNKQSNMTHLFGKLLIEKTKKRKECTHFPVFLSFPPDISLIKAKYIDESFLNGEFIFFFNFLLMFPQVTWFVQMDPWY